MRHEESFLLMAAAVSQLSSKLKQDIPVFVAVKRPETEGEFNILLLSPASNKPSWKYVYRHYPLKHAVVLFRIQPAPPIVIPKVLVPAVHAGRRQEK